jgi:hypothetical protein
MNEWTKKRDLLVEETLAFVQGVATEPPKATDSPKPVVPSVPRPVAAEVPSPKSRLDMERAVIKKRVANFKDIPRFIDSPKNRLPWGDFGIRHGA